eukprot:PhF_6_TR38578/c0_g1_i1/m.57286
MQTASRLLARDMGYDICYLWIRTQADHARLRDVYSSTVSVSCVHDGSCHVFECDDAERIESGVAHVCPHEKDSNRELSGCEHVLLAKHKRRRLGRVQQPCHNNIFCQSHSTLCVDIV